MPQHNRTVPTGNLNMTEILLRELNNADLDWMVSEGEQRSLAVGDRLSLGSAAEVYCILDGTLEQAERDDAVPIQFGGGEILGSEVLLDLPPSLIKVQATAAATLLALPEQALTSRLEQNTGFAARCYRALALVLSERLRQIYKQSAALNRPHQKALQEALFVLGELRDSDIDWLTVAGHIKTLAPGDFLLQAGRPVDALHLVLEGTFSVLWLDGEVNPLKACFDCPIEMAGQMQQITTLTKGAMAGTSAFLDFAPLSVTIRAQGEVLVLSVPRQTVVTRLQQDVEFSARFHRVLAIQLSKLMQAVGGAEIASEQMPESDRLDIPLEDGELDLDALQNASQGAARFNWMLQRLGVG